MCFFPLSQLLVLWVGERGRERESEFWGELLLVFHNMTISSLLSFRHITDATLAIVKGETVPLDVLQIKVSPFLSWKIFTKEYTVTFQVRS